MSELLIAVEHLEPCISPWLLLEYRHVSKIFGKDKVFFTNVKKDNEAKLLSDLGRVFKESFTELFSQEEILILDPQAPKELRKEDLNDVKAVVIGGILGDHPPRGRTKELITTKVPKAKARNIGKYQFSIDGAAYVVKKIIGGIPLERINYVINYELRFKIMDIEYTVILPFAYPIDKGKAVITPGLIDLLRSRIVYYEHNLLNEIIKCDP